MSFLQVLRCFSSLRSLLTPMYSKVRYLITIPRNLFCPHGQRPADRAPDNRRRASALYGSPTPGLATEQIFRYLRWVSHSVSMDQSSFAAPHGFSQRITSFFACACQGIHQMPLRHLIVLIANAHHQATIRLQKLLPFYKSFVTMTSTCSIRSLYWSYAEQLTCANH